MKKVSNILMYVIIAISLIVTIYFLADPHEERAGTLFIWTYILMGLGIALLVAVPILNVRTNPASLKKGAINIAFMVVLFGLAYLFASDSQTTATAAQTIPPSPATLKITDTGLIATYLLLAIGVCSIIFASVYTGLKNR